MPRSGTSMVTGLLGELGLWLGNTVPGGDRSNPRGFFEHAALREQVVKQILTRLGCDPLGVRKLPMLVNLPQVGGLRDRVETLVRAEGYDGASPWGFKDAKLTLLWPIWHSAFPDARWLIVSRPRDLVIRSCLKTGFMRQHSDRAEFWEKLCNEYDRRLADLRKFVPSVMDIDASDLIRGDFDPLSQVAARMGLTWNAGCLDGFIDPAYWGDRNPGSADIRP